MRLPILDVDTDDIAKRVLVVGDPARAAKAAALLDNVRHVATNREYATYRGFHNGTEVGVVSHGVGGAGAGVCFEELCRGGAERIIRAGTCGGMQPNIVDGHLVIVTGAVREDGLTERLVPMSFPALATVEVVNALRAAAGTGPGLHEGVALTGAVFYPGVVLGSELELWQRAGVSAVEMECAPLFVIAALNQRQAGAILVVDGNPLVEKDDDMSGYDPHRPVVHEAVDRMIGIALDALVA